MTCYQLIGDNKQMWKNSCLIDNFTQELFRLRLFPGLEIHVEHHSLYHNKISSYNSLAPTHGVL